MVIYLMALRFFIVLTDKVNPFQPSRTLLIIEG
jgi:hypothetical protein